jgi:hypothetical protein
MRPPHRWLGIEQSGHRHRSKPITPHRQHGHGDTAERALGGTLPKTKILQII